VQFAAALVDPDVTDPRSGQGERRRQTADAGTNDGDAHSTTVARRSAL
jgi:hypothetical protein